MEKMTATPVRGMRDLLPEEARLRDYMAQKIAEVYSKWGFERIETPALERIEYLTSGQGGENEKLIFRVMKRGEKLNLQTASSENDLVDSGLRFDLTVPLSRFVATNISSLKLPLKSLQIGHVWRAERPQRGRYRQFTQCDIDTIGMDAPFAEIELIVATSECLTALELSDFRVRVNDRRILSALVAACGFPDEATPSVLIALDKADKIGVDGVAAELAEFAESSVKKLINALSSEALTVREFVNNYAPEVEETIVTDLEEVITKSNASVSRKDSVVFDPFLVRGMGYYTGVVFEAWHPDYPFSLAGGGRYDKMIGRFLGKDIPACGFSIGFERVFGILKDRKTSGVGLPKRVAVLFEDKEGYDIAHAFARNLRLEGAVVSVIPKRKRIGTQIEELRLTGFQYVWLTENGETRQLRTESRE